MSRFASVKVAVMALLSAALVTISPLAMSPAQAAVVTLSGTITDAGGQPVNGGRVRVRAVGGTAILTSATANSAGFYSVSVEQGTYDLTYLGAPQSGLLARAPSKSVPVSSTFDVQVTAQSITLAGAATGPTQGPASATVDLVDENATLGHAEVAASDTYSFTVLPGEYRLVFTYNTNGGSTSFGGYSPRVFYEEDSRIDLAVPVHPLQLRVEDEDGDPVEAEVNLHCDSFDAPSADWPEGLDWGENLQVNGEVLAHLVNADPGGTCALDVWPQDEGVAVQVDLPVGTTEHTVVIEDGIHLTGTMNDGEGNSPTIALFTGRAPPDADGNQETTDRDRDPSTGAFDLEVAPGATSVFGSTNHSVGRYEQMFVTMAPSTYTVDTVVPVTAATSTMTVELATADGTPVDSDVALECEGQPAGQTAVLRQRTVDNASGSSVELGGAPMVEDTGHCVLTVEPEGYTEFIIEPFVFQPGETLELLVEPGVTVSGQVIHPDIPSFDSAEVSISRSPGTAASAIGSVQPDGSYTVQNAPTGEVYFSVYGDQPGWGQFGLDRVLNLNGDVSDLDIALQVDDLEVYLLDDEGNPATATLHLRCGGIPSGEPDDSQLTDVTRTGTGQVTMPGFASSSGSGSCQLTTTFQGSGLVITTPVQIAPGGSTITQIENGSVTILGSPTATLDGDSVADALEAYAPHTGDGDEDGTPDYQQADVASLPEKGGGLASGEKYLTVEGPASSALDDVSTEDVAETADGSELPDGLVDFTLTGVPDNSTQTVEIHLGSTTGINGYAVRNNDGTWEDMPADLVTVTPTSIELTLEDNGRFDLDPTLGRIKHPGGGTRVDIEVPVVLGKALTEPNDKGWYKSNVTVTWTATDDKDTIPAPANTVASVEGGDVTATSAPACDRRGNCGVGVLQHLKIDKTDPVVAIAGPVDGATYELSAVPARRCTATDVGGSGVPDQDCVVTVSGGTRAGIGTVTVAGTGTDRAGNSNRKSISYKVVYAAGGLVAPSAGGKLKVFKKGSTVVVRVKIRDASGAVVTPAQAPTWLKPVKAGKAKTRPNQPVSDAKPDKGSTLLKRGKFWEFRWGTAKVKKGKAYLLTVRLDDGTTRTVKVGIN